ncbi:hypothetical protein Phi17:1_gp7 [Cellulophaga phage phi17:1]|uniref:Uncharacterized protein n=1 Tax=Cellulophaga phage phi17:1 TaxID=1327980 RepID=S0A240_9CAUD|nr:hypothetical protein Phi17:1_gp7 [Cellulophaga phage phi17:1]AGO48283.1 hypothetical protein Phi17:1_gp7 [Cellulophaga phage phi17:1]
MRIVNKQEFYKLPKGTLFAKYEPIIFDGLCIKYQNTYNHKNEPIDYVYESLLGNVDCESSEHFGDILFEAEENGNSFKLDFDCIERDGCYDDEELFAVYEKEDVVKFIRKLNFCKSILEQE